MEKVTNKQITLDFETDIDKDEKKIFEDIDFDFFESTGQGKIPQLEDEAELDDELFKTSEFTISKKEIIDNFEKQEVIEDKITINLDDELVEKNSVNDELTQENIKSLFDDTDEMNNALGKLNFEEPVKTEENKFSAVDEIADMMPSNEIKEKFQKTMEKMLEQNTLEDEQKFELTQDDLNLPEEAIDRDIIKEYGKVNILTIGVGGAGINAISKLRANKSQTKTIAIDTYEVALDKAKVDKKILLGNGLGVGNDINKTEEFFKEKEKIIQKHLENVDMIFIVGGLGRTTGSTIIPKIAQMAKDKGILTVSIVTLPFENEGLEARNIAEESLTELTFATDTYILIENEKLAQNGEIENLFDMYQSSDIALIESIQGVMDVIYKTGYMNTDFADIKTTLADSGPCVIGIGVGVSSFENRDKKIEDGIMKALNSDLISDINLNNCEKAILNLSFRPRSCTISDADLAAKILNEKININNDLIFGIVYDEKLAEDEMKVTIIATGNKNIDPVFEYKNKAYHLNRETKSTIKINNDEEKEPTPEKDKSFLKKPSFFN